MKEMEVDKHTSLLDEEVASKPAAGEADWSSGRTPEETKTERHYGRKTAPLS